MQPYNENLPPEELQKKFLATLTWYFQEKETPTGLYSKIGQIPDRIEQLNQNLTQASDASDKLTKALNRITLAGAIIAGLGLLVAIANLIFELVKYSAAK